MLKVGTIAYMPPEVLKITEESLPNPDPALEAVSDCPYNSLSTPAHYVTGTPTLPSGAVGPTAACRVAMGCVLAGHRVQRKLRVWTLGLLKIASAAIVFGPPRLQIR